MTYDTTTEAVDALRDALVDLGYALRNEARGAVERTRDRWDAAWKLDLSGPWTDHWPETFSERLNRLVREGMTEVARRVAQVGQWALANPGIIEDFQRIESIRSEARRLELPSTYVDRLVDVAVYESRVTGRSFRVVLDGHWAQVWDAIFHGRPIPLLKPVPTRDADGRPYIGGHSLDRSWLDEPADLMGRARVRREVFAESVKRSPADFVVIHGEHGGSKFQGIRQETWRDRLADLWYRRSVR